MLVKIIRKQTNKQTIFLKNANLEFSTHQKYSPRGNKYFSDKCKLREFITLYFQCKKYQRKILRLKENNPDRRIELQRRMKSRTGKYVGNINELLTVENINKRKMSMGFITWEEIYNSNRENEKKLNGTYYLILELFEI